MENFIIGLIGITIGFCTGYILGARREAEKHRLCHRRQREAAAKLEGFSKFLGIDLAHEIDRAVAVEAKVEGGKIVSIKEVKLPENFGKMKDEIKPKTPDFGFAPAVKTPTAKAPEKKKRVSKPRTAAQRKQARDRMRIYRAKKKASQK